MNLVILLLLLPSIFVSFLPSFRLFLCSRHVATVAADNDVVDYNGMLLVILYLLPPMNRVLLLLLLLFPSTSGPLLPLFEFFLCSRHVVVADTAADTPTAANVDDDDDDGDNYVDEYDLAPAVSLFVGL